MTEPGIYRRYGPAFSGTRPALQLGDDGIDRHWLRQRHWGIFVLTSWFVGLPLALAIGFFSQWGVFGWVDTWQLHTFGSGNVILLVLLFTPLMFLPIVIAHFATISASTPFLLGMRQALDADWGPKVLGDPHQVVARLRSAQRIAAAVAILGAVTIAGAVWKWHHDAAAPHAALPRVSFARLIDATVLLPDAVQVTGVVADRAHQWIYKYSVRQDAHQDVYFPLRPLAQPSTAPVALVELDETSPQYAAAPWNMVDAPGAREGIPSVLSPWNAQQLHSAGFPLASRVVVLKRQQLHGVNPYPDPFDNMLYVMIGTVAVFLGGLITVPLGRMRRARETEE